MHTIGFQTFFVWAFKIVVDSWKFTILLLYILWDDWPIFMISGSNQQLQQQLEYTQLTPGCHSWWISKMQSDTLEERYAIKFCFKFGKKCHRNVWNSSDCFWAILHESSISFWRRILRVLASFDGISSWTLLKLQHRNPEPNPNPLANQLWCIDFLTPSTPLIIPHWLPAFLESLMPLKNCDEGHWHAHTRGLPWGLPEVIGTVQQVHCSQRRWLWRGLEFRVCTINKSAHTKKVWKLIVYTSYVIIDKRKLASCHSLVFSERLKSLNQWKTNTFTTLATGMHLLGF